MTYERSEESMISDSCDIKAFMKAMEEKTLLEIVAFADREAMAAWRRTHRQG